MNERQKKLATKVGRLTQRLETAITDESLSPEQNAQAVAELKTIAQKLATIIPDPVFSPEQRVERIAHGIDGMTANLDLLEPASHTLARLKSRIDQLIPGADLTTEAKLGKLGELFRAAFPERVRDIA